MIVRLMWDTIYVIYGFIPVSSMGRVSAVMGAVIKMGTHGIPIIHPTHVCPFNVAEELSLTYFKSWWCRRKETWWRWHGSTGSEQFKPLCCSEFRSALDTLFDTLKEMQMWYVLREPEWLTTAKSTPQGPLGQGSLCLTEIPWRCVGRHDTSQVLQSVLGEMPQGGNHGRQIKRSNQASQVGIRLQR